MLFSAQAPPHCRSGCYSHRIHLLRVVLAMSISRGLDSYDSQILGINVEVPGVQRQGPEPNRRFDLVLDCIKQNGFRSLGQFLVELFSVASNSETEKSQALTQTVSSFLDGKSTKHTVVDLVNVIYHSRFSEPIPLRSSTTPNDNKHRTDEQIMARYMLRQWALDVVEDMLGLEAETLASPACELRLAPDVSWDFATDFSFERVLKVAQTVGPSIVRVLEAISVPAKGCRAHRWLRRPGLQETTQDSRKSIFHDHALLIIHLYTFYSLRRALYPASIGSRAREA